MCASVPLCKRNLEYAASDLANQDFERHTAVHSPPFRGAVVRDWPRFAIAERGHTLRIDLMPQHQIAHHDLRTSLAEAEVVQISANRVGVAFDHHAQAWVIFD